MLRAIIPAFNTGLGCKLDAEDVADFVIGSARSYISQGQDDLC